MPPSRERPTAATAAALEATADGAEPTPEAAVAPPQGYAALREAVAAYRRGQVAAGDVLRAKHTEPGPAFLLDWTAVRFAAPALGLDRVLAFGRAYPDLAGPWLRRRAEEALLAEKRGPAAVRGFFARELPQTPGGKLALALALRADGLDEDAAAIIRDAWRTDTFGRELEGRMLDAFKDVLGTADHRARMERLLLRENWDGARRAAVQAGPGYDALVKARIAVDNRAPGAGKLLDAVPAALKGDSSYLFSRSQHLRRAEKHAEAGALLAASTRDPATLADGDAWWIERRLVARELLDAGDARAAYAAASAHGAVSGERRIEAEFLAGWIALRFLREPDTARRHLDRAAGMAGTPISQSRVAYWQGRTAEAAGAPAEANSFYVEAARQGTTYYGQLAGSKLGAERLPLRPASTGPERDAAAGSPIVAGIAVALAAGLRDVAVPLLVELARNAPDPALLEAAAAKLRDAGDVRALLVLGKAATQRGLPLDEAAFPTEGVPPFDPLGNAVERAMVHAIARQESAFDPAALSTAGARGLMQLMPGTALLTAKRAGVPLEAARLGEAGYNAQLGAAHLGDLMQDWRGSYILTFASYNAGPGNVRKWIRAYGDPRDPGVDAVDWVERIPFSETRNYVQRVMENLQVYRRRLDDRSALLIEGDLKRGGQASPAP